MFPKFLRQVRDLKLDLTGLKIVAASSLTVAGLLLGVRHMGWLQSLELQTFDQMVRFRPTGSSDPRLLIVTITEEDHKKYGAIVSDRDMARVLSTLQQHQPQAIGLDVYRDLPQEPGHQELVTQLQKPNVIAITLIGKGTKDDLSSIPPPPNMSVDQVGFNDVVTDEDGVVRRNLLFAETETGTLTSFGLQLALIYLNKRNSEPWNDDKNPDLIHWGKATFLPLEKSSGAYQYNDAAGYQILLNYRVNRQIAQHVTLSEVLEKRVDPSLIKDKIVLIGTTAPSSKDFFFTPYSAAEREDARMPGVEVHAQMVSQILDAVSGERSLFWFWSDWIEVIWIGGWALVGGTLAWYVRHPVVLGVGSIGLLGGLVGTCFGILLNHGWVPLAAPALAFLVTGGAVVAYRAQQAQRQQQMTMTLLGQNASPEIAAALWNSRDRLIEDGRLPGQKLVATMLFTDIKDFSTISEQMQPEDLLNWLNEYLAVMTREVQLHQGIVNKFTGDGLIAVFGVPVARLTDTEIAEDARRAVACALAMGEHLEGLNQNWQERNLSSIQIRVGIFTGPIVAGSLGGKERMEYGIIGDSVNTASRLESCEKERQEGICRILIAQETLRYIQGQFQVEHWGLLSLKGKQQMVDVYRVLGHVPTENVTASSQISHNSQEHFGEATDIKESMLHTK